MTQKTVAIAADHAGVAMKAELVDFIAGLGWHVLDLGTHGPESVDYPDYGHAVAEALEQGKAAMGIVICGSGIGISIAANRHAHVRCALCHDGLAAELARQHNDANVLALGSRMIGIAVAKDCVTRFLNTDFEGGRHQHRLNKL